MSFLENFKDYFKSLKEPEHRLAWAVAIAADTLQIAAFPFFAEGAVSPADSALDLIVAFLMIRLLGWHWAFLPTLAAELIPGADLFPTWTAAVWFVTRQKLKAGPEASPTSSSTSEFNSDFNPSSNSNSHSHATEPEILPPGPAPAPRR